LIWKILIKKILVNCKKRGGILDIVFMGTPDFAIPSLNILNDDPEINIKSVITQPDRKKSRGQKVLPSPIKKIAQKMNLSVFQPLNVNSNDSLEYFKNINPDLIIVVAYGQKLSKKLLDLPKYGCINLHASLLPKYRGSSPIHMAIINGDDVSGVTTMFMNEGLDTGDIIYQKKLKIKDEYTVGEFHDKLANIGANLLLETTKNIINGVAPKFKQNENDASYSSKLDKKIGKINWNKSAIEIFNLVRGVNPWPGAYTYFRGDLLKIWEVDYDLGINNYNSNYGEIIKVLDNKGIFVNTSNGVINIITLQLAGKRRMNFKDFIHGYHIEIGEKFN